MRGGFLMSLAPLEAPAPILNASHRCDRCGSRAYVVTVLARTRKLPYGGELLFCSHHWKRIAEAITPLLSAIVDETAHLTRHATDDGGPR